MGFADLLAMGDRVVRPTLGGPVTYAPSVGVAVVVSGIFTAPHTDVPIGDAGSGVSTISPTCFLTVADLPSDPEVDTGARLTVAGVTYRWHDSQPDGMGGVLLILTRV